MSVQNSVLESAMGFYFSAEFARGLILGACNMPCMVSGVVSRNPDQLDLAFAFAGHGVVSGAIPHG